MQQIRSNLMSDMLEPTVSAAVPGDIGRRGVADRQRRGGPEIACVFVAQIERFARPIAHRIIRPRRDLILTAVDRPRVAAAVGSNLEAERRIGDHVDPRRGRRLAWPEDGHVLASVSREPAETVEKLEIGDASLSRGP